MEDVRSHPSSRSKDQGWEEKKTSALDSWRSDSRVSRAFIRLFKRRDARDVLDCNPLRDHVPQDVRNRLAGQLVVIPEILHLLGINLNRTSRFAGSLFLHKLHR